MHGANRELDFVFLNVCVQEAMTLAELVEKHHNTIEQAISANKKREFYAHWPEPPSGKIYGESANADGEARFKSSLNKPFEGLLQTGAVGTVGSETSPWGFTLGIEYPQVPIATLVQQASDAQTVWQSLSVRQRAAVLVESLERASARFFEIGYATMHTTGQGFVMAFQSSGPHGFDRGLEAVAMGVTALETFAESVTWAKPLGKSSVRIHKTYRTVPKGINLVIGCSTFPVWNTTPGLFAGLITGNSVIVKPHPGAVLPIAILVAEMQTAFKDAGLDANIVQLGADTANNPITLELLEHPAVRVVDYTGGPNFGQVVQHQAAAHGKVVFTETAGVNCVILHSADDLDSALDNLAFSLCLYSGQMCTAPQNIFIPKDGMLVGGSLISPLDVAALLCKKISALVANPKMGPGTLGTIQNTATLHRLEKAQALGLEVLLESAPIEQTGFHSARSVSPLVLKANTSHMNIFEQEWFGPISFFIETESFHEAVTLVAKSVREHGALSTLVYCTNDASMVMAENAIVAAGAPVAFNLDNFVWVNQSAAFSDFHGTGANPSGSASFADMQFVSSRYNIVGVRRQLPANQN